MLEWLLKYPPALFHRGSVHIDWSWWLFALAIVALAVLAGAMIAWRPLSGDSAQALSGRRLGVLTALRGGLLSLLLLALLSPVLVVSLPTSKVPTVAVLIDDSLSMGIEDVGGLARSAAALQQFAPGVGTVSAALEARFEVRYYGYGSRSHEVVTAADLSFRAARSDLASAVEELVAASGQNRPSTLIIVGDGQIGSGAKAAFAAARSRGMVVHTVGVGSERFDQDLELADVRLPRMLLRDERIDAELTLQHRGYPGEAVRLTVESDGVLLHDTHVDLPASEEPVNIRLPVSLDVSGLHRLEFRIAAREGERVLENNSASLTVEVSDRPLDILHVEGEPRFEVKFLRRALADDGNLRLVSLVRTAENKFYRLGVRDESELAGGFPETAEALFRYRALVLGSLEASALSDEQHELIRDFVAKRGGGLLFLGGRFALAEGGYAQSLLAGLLPVRLEPVTRRFRAALEVRPAHAAGRDPILRMDPAHVTAWNALPALTMLNPIRTAKPGASVLLQGRDESSREWIVLAHHRYGRGRVAVLPVRDSWRWQMHSSIPPDDLTHELFWRQLLRWVARGAEERIRFTKVPSDGVPGETARFELQTLGADFSPSQEGEVRISVVTPPGDIEVLEPVWSAERVGAYQANLVPGKPGVYELQAELLQDGRRVAWDSKVLEVRTQGREFFHAELGRERLRQLAEEGGGRYFGIDAAGALPGAVVAHAQGAESTRRLPLWDAPILLLLLLSFAGAEWLLRRRWGLA